MNEIIPVQEAPRKTPNQVLVYSGILFAVVAWGASFVAARFLLYPQTPGQAVLSPTVLAALRFSIASLFFVVPLVRAVIQHQVTRRDLLLMGLLGQITFSLYFWLQYTGVQKTNASISSILVVGLIPVVTAFFAQFFGDERLNIILAPRSLEQSLERSCKVGHTSMGGAALSSTGLLGNSLFCLQRRSDQD